MGYYNFAHNGYLVLNPLQPGECWNLGSAWLVFSVADSAGSHCTMSFTRPTSDAERIYETVDQQAMELKLSGPKLTPASVGGAVALVAAIVNFFKVATKLAAPPEMVEQSVNAFGLGYDEGHVGTRERHDDRYEQAVRDAGRDSLARYRTKLRQGGFFTPAPGWYTRGALASASDVMILRLDSTLTHLEITGFVDDRQAGVCRVVTGYAVRRPPEVS